jgi:hypothetical protein
MLEKLIYQRLSHYLYKNNLLNQKQFCFTVQKSTEDAVNYLIDKIKAKSEVNKFFLTISFDI